MINTECGVPSFSPLNSTDGFDIETIDYKDIDVGLNTSSSVSTYGKTNTTTNSTAVKTNATNTTTTKRFLLDLDWLVN